MSELYIAKIRTQQATIDRLTEQLAEVEAIKALQAEQESHLQKMKELFLTVTDQRDRLLAMLKDEEEHVYDSTCPYCGGKDYHHDKHASGCHHSRRLALIAEIEAGK